MSDLREFLMLAKTFDPNKDSIGGWYMSEKLDGMRAMWDGGVTRGFPCNSVHFANVSKHDRFVNQQYSTGLWSRYGQPIHAPNWWLDSLPKVLLDGELYAGRGKFQFVTSTVKDHHPNDQDWKKISYMVFDSPPINMVFENGKINNTNFKKTFKDVHVWFKELPTSVGVANYPALTSFEGTQHLLKKVESMHSGLKVDSPFKVHEQIQLPLSQEKALKEIEYWLEVVSKEGGEGLMLRKRESYWEPSRMKTLLKVKRMQDSEGIVIGCVTGRKTDLGSKLLGKMGALILEWHGKEFELSGFTDEERQLFMPDGMTGWPIDHPGERCPKEIFSRQFPTGTKITFKYRKLTDDGIPKEARYWRKA
jgi:DNA ligase 1